MKSEFEEKNKIASIINAAASIHELIEAWEYVNKEYFPRDNFKMLVVDKGLEILKKIRIPYETNLFKSFVAKLGLPDDFYLEEVLFKISTMNN